MDTISHQEIMQAKQRLGIIGNAPALLAAIERTLRVAPIDLSVLITGESGTGKEFFPKLIHQYSSRKHSKYIAVNCGAIPEGTIDSELFGHEKGAFTGAVASRKGYFEEADGGTIFLDEVAELPLTTQARLLRVLETGEFLKVGSSVVQKTNIRIVAATNVDINRAVRDGRFREDLYYRLSTVEIEVPPLRDRGNDINLLTRKFAADFAERWRLPQITFTDDARMLLDRYRWPGNVRQLKNVVEQLAIFEAGHDIDSATLRKYLPANADMAAPAVISRDHTYENEREMLMSLIVNMQKRIDELEKRLSASTEHSLKAVSPVTSPILHHNSLKYRSLMPDEDVDDEGFISYSEAEPATNVADNIGRRPSAAEQPAFRSMRERERDAIRDALARSGGHRREAAEELKISQRTLYRKIKEYGLE